LWLNLHLPDFKKNQNPMAGKNSSLSATDFAAQSYDYVIVGGGTAGLVVAARLSENANISVGVIEAGTDRSEDVLVRAPLLHTELYEKPEYDWLYKTTPQGKNSKVHAWPRGKLLGGSSSINFSMLAKPSKLCIDSWAALGNPGWDWEGMLPYYRKFMTLNPPPADTAQLLDTTRMQKWIADGNGPIQASWPPLEYTSFQQQMGPEVGKSLGLRDEDADIGASTGYYDQALSVDMKKGRRSSAVYEFYHPNAHRKNLSLVMDAMTQRIVFGDDTSNGEKVATGVEFVVDGKKYTVGVKKEIVICAGTIGSAQLLELSGIGNKSLLEKHGIKCLVDNPNVGENLQDHIMSGISYETVPGVATIEDLKKAGVMEMLIGEYEKAPIGLLVNQLTSSIFASLSSIIEDKAKLKEKVDAMVPSSKTSGDSAEAKAMKIHRDRLLDPDACSLWFISLPGGIDLRNTSHGSGIFNHSDPGNYFMTAVGLSHPMSRGSTHIQSADVNVMPLMDPRYLSNAADLALLAEGLRYLDAKLIHTEPMASNIKDGPNGTKKKMPAYEGFALDKVEEHAQNYLSTQWHIMSSCSMLPKEDGGVVDPKLKVYGIANVRVIDASIIPLEVQANIQTSVYAVAEKGADLIKESW
jgi:choline dehydrogenase-like flavoprotein